MHVWKGPKYLSDAGVRKSLKILETVEALSILPTKLSYKTKFNENE